MVKVKCIVISFSYILYTLEQTIYRLDSFVKLVAGKPTMHLITVCMAKI